MQLVRLFHQMHPDEPSAEYTASNQLSGFEELWVSRLYLGYADVVMETIRHQSLLVIRVFYRLFSVDLQPFCLRVDFYAPK